jgi:hypothetical protein
MVQTYGVVPETSLEPSIDTDEARALLADPNAPSKRDRHADGHATLTSSISNLLNTIIGSGAYITSPSVLTYLTNSPGMLTFPLVNFYQSPISLILTLVYRQWLQQD